MANNWVRGSVELAKIAAVESATGSGRLVRDISGSVIERVQPGSIPQEIAAQQAIWRQFERRFAVIDLDDPEKDPEVEAYMAAETLLEQSEVSQDTAVELRVALPESALWNGVLTKRRERALEALQLALEEENIMSIFNSEPITPSRDGTSRHVDAWRAFAPQLDGLAHQFRNDGDYDPAMLAITDPAYERAMFGGRAAILGSPMGSNLLALDRAGKRPEENVLTWLSPP